MSRRQQQGRFRLAGGEEESVPVVDQADCTAQSCRSCVAVSLADCIALGCCPCAVVSLLGLAFVRLPLAVARRCVRRLRRRQGRLRQKKRVRDMDAAAAAKNAAGGGGCSCHHHHQEATSKGEEGNDADVATVVSSPGNDVSESDVEKVWLELYQVGRWGFGRLSVSAPVRPPVYVSTGHNADVDGS
uniref:Uncharacterized protein n=1 Tax=Leersia perrieri TaxID=77586 RepID=A0A0D9V3S7_9ORYZ